MNYPSPYEQSTLASPPTLWNTAMRAREKKEIEGLPATRRQARIESEPEVSG